MDDLNKSIDRYFRVAVIWTILMLLGIPLVIFGALNYSKGALYIICLAAGVIFIFTGFYGCPISWVQWSEKKRYKRIVNLITSRESTTVEILAGSLALKEGDALNDVKYCLEHGYLTGYILRGNKVMLASLIDPDRMSHHAKCGYCGATFEFQGRNGRCPYCGNFLTDQSVE